MTRPQRTDPSDGAVPFFAWVFVLSVPFWAAGLWVRRPILPGLPVSALAVVCPVTAAAIFAWRRAGARAVSALLRRSWDLSRVPSARWFPVALLLFPAVHVLANLLGQRLRGPLPPVQTSVPEVVLLSLVFLVAAEAEELGWSAHAVEALRRGHGPVQVGLIVGVVWAVWHAVPLVEANRSAGWIAAWAAGTVAQRMLLVWIYERAGRSVLLVSIAHASSNVAWQLSAEHGARFDPVIHALLVALLAAVVAWTWRRPASG